MLCGEFVARTSGSAGQSTGSYFEQPAEKLTQLLIKTIEAEEPKLDARMIADVVLRFFHGFCIAQNLKRGKASSERKIRNLMQVVRNL